MSFNLLNILKKTVIKYSLKIKRPILEEFVRFINNEPFCLIPLNTLEDYGKLNIYLVEHVEQYKLQFYGINSELYRLLEKEMNPVKSPYTYLISFCYKKVNQFLKQLSIYLTGVFEFDQTLLNETNRLLIEFSDLLMKKITGESLELKVLAYISNDLKHLSNFDTFIVERAEELTGQTFRKDFTFGQVMAQAK